MSSRDSYRILTYKGGIPKEDPYFATILTFGIPHYTPEMITDSLEDESVIVYIILHEEVPISFIITPMDPSHHCDEECFDCVKQCAYITLICIAPPFRGKGHTAHIFEKMGQVFKTMGYTCIRLTASNKATDRVYRSLGFVNEKTTGSGDCIYKLVKHLVRKRSTSSREMSSGRTRRHRSRSESALPNEGSARDPEQLERVLDRLMKSSHPKASTLKELIRRSSEFGRGQGYIEPAKAVGQMQYVAGRLDVDALELARIRDMIKEYGKKIGVYEAKAHREMKKHMKVNTRRKKESVERHRLSAEKRNAETRRRNAALARRRNEDAAAAEARRRARPPPAPARPESPAFEFASGSEEEKETPAAAAPPSKMPTGKLWSKPGSENPPI